MCIITEPPGGVVHLAFFCGIVHLASPLWTGDDDVPYPEALEDQTGNSEKVVGGDWNCSSWIAFLLAHEMDQSVTSILTKIVLAHGLISASQPAIS